MSKIKNASVMTVARFETARAAGSPGVAARPSRRAVATARLGLIWTLVRTDFKARYHGTVSGFAWALLKPASIFLVLMTVFSFLFTDPQYKLRLIIGLFLWDFFAEATKTGLISLHAKSFLVTKVRAPLWILAISSLSNAIITLTVFALGVVAFLCATGHAPSIHALTLFVLYCLALIAIASGFTLASSVLFLRYRDLNQIWDVASQAGFFLAPIIYPLDIIPERFHFYFYLWPPTSIVEFSRSVLVAGRLPTITAHVYLLLDALTILTLGALLFRRLSPRAAEYL